MSKWLDRYLKEIALSTADKTDKNDISSELSALSVNTRGVSRFFLSDYADEYLFHEFFEERAAIMEFEGEMRKDEAEKQARLDIEKYLMEVNHEITV